MPAPALSDGHALAVIVECLPLRAIAALDALLPAVGSGRDVLTGPGTGVATYLVLLATRTMDSALPDVVPPVYLHSL